MGVQVNAASVRRRRAGVGALSIASRPYSLAASATSIDPSTGAPIAHFAYMPPEAVRGVQLRLAAWGRPKMLPSPSSPYGYDGPLFPGDFADMNNATDLDGVDSHRTGLAIASFQRWANKADAASGQPLRTDGIYDEATHDKLVMVTGASLPSTVPGLPTVTPNGTSVVVTPPSGNVVTGPWPGSANGSPNNPQLPASVPGNVLGPSSGTGNQPAEKPIWPVLAIVAGVGGLITVVVVARRRRRRSA